MDCLEHESAISTHQQAANSANFLWSQQLLRRLFGHFVRRNRGHFHRAIVAALDVRMSFVTRNQQEGMPERENVSGGNTWRARCRVGARWPYACLAVLELKFIPYQITFELSYLGAGIANPRLCWDR